MSLRHALATISALALFALAAPQAHAALTVQQTINPDTVRPGERIVVSLTVANDGGSAEAIVELRALIPAQFNSVNRLSNATGSPLCTGNNPCASGNQLVWALGTIPAGRAVTVSYWSTIRTGAAAPADGTSIQATAQVFQNAVLRDDDARNVIVDSGKALTLALDEDLDSVEPGAALTYTLVYGNRSIDPVSNATLSFPVPAGTTVLAADGGTVAGGSVTWNLGSVLTGQSGRHQVVVSVGALAAGTLLRVDPASVSGTSPAGAESARASELTRVETGPALALAAAVNPDPVRPSERIRTDLTVSNRSGAAVSGVHVTTRLPDATGSVGVGSNTTGAAACTGNNPCAAGNQLVWTIGTLAAGKTVTVSYWATVLSGVSAPANGDLLGVEAVATADGGHQALASHTVPVNANKALTLELDDDLNTVTAGGVLTYTLSYGNRSIGTVTGATLAFPVPAGTTVLGADGGSLANGIVSWNLGSLLAGQSGRHQVVVAVGGALPSGTLLRVNAATVAGSGLVGQEAARATAVTRVETTDALALAVAVNPDPARPGERVRADFTVSNQGLAAIFNVQVTARVPDQVGGVNVNANATGAPACTGNNPCGSGNQLVWSLGTLAPGQTLTVSYWTIVTSGASAPVNGEFLVVDAAATADGSHQALASYAVAVNSNKALTLEVDDDLDAVAPGGSLTYTLQFGNRGIASVTSATLRIPAPVGTTVVDAGGGTVSNGIVSFSLGTLAPGQSGRRQVVVSVGQSVAGGALLRVNAASLGGSGNAGPESARASEVTRVETDEPLALAIAVNPDAVRPGERLRADLAVSNRSDTALFNVKVTARLSDHTGGVNLSANATGGPACTGNNPCAAGNQLVWTIGTLPPGATAAVSYWAFALTGASGPLNGDLVVVDAVATADGSHQAISSHTVEVNAEKTLALEVDDDLDAVEPGETLTYTLTYGNRSLNTVTGATLRFPVPAGTTLQGSGAGSVANGVVTWNLGTLTPGEAGRRRLTVAVDSGTPGGSLLRVDAAEIAGTTSAGPVHEDGTEVTRVEAAAALTLQVQAAPDLTGPGVATTTTLTVHNLGTDPAFGVVLAARIPDESGSVNLQVNTTGTPLCTGSNPCGAGSQLVWQLGTLASEQSVTVTYTGTILSGASAPSAGTPIVFDARVTDQSGPIATRSDTVVVGLFSDIDADGVADVLDNCTTLANPDQRDSNGDGYGNACDPDLNNDGVVNFVDLARMKLVFFTTDADADLNGDGIVNFTDLARMKSLFFKPPGPSALAP